MRGSRPSLHCALLAFALGNIVAFAGCGDARNGPGTGAQAGGPSDAGDGASESGDGGSNGQDASGGGRGDSGMAGDSSTGGDSRTPVFACNYDSSSSFDPGICNAYFGSSSANGIGSLTTGCTTTKGLVVTTCSTTGLVGVCKIGIGQSYEEWLYYYSPHTASSSQKDCPNRTSGLGTWYATP
jgi:hypothetical protein